jgi:hypothetical protein
LIIHNERQIYRKKNVSQVTDHKLEKQGSILGGAEIFLSAKMCSPALESITSPKPAILKLLCPQPKIINHSGLATQTVPGSIQHPIRPLQFIALTLRV